MSLAKWRKVKNLHRASPWSEIQYFFPGLLSSSSRARTVDTHGRASEASQTGAPPASLVLSTSDTFSMWANGVSIEPRRPRLACPYPGFAGQSRDRDTLPSVRGITLKRPAGGLHWGTPDSWVGLHGGDCYFCSRNTISQLEAVQASQTIHVATMQLHLEDLEERRLWGLRICRTLYWRSSTVFWTRTHQ